MPAAQKTNLSSGKLAVERLVNEKEKAAGHKLVNIKFIDSKHADIEKADTFVEGQDLPAFNEILKALGTNGFQVTSNR